METGNKVVWTFMGLVGLAAMMFLFGAWAGMKGWFGPGNSGMVTQITQWSLVAIVLFCGGLGCSLPFYHGR